MQTSSGSLSANGLEHFDLGTKQAELGIHLRIQGGEQGQLCLKVFVTYPWEIQEGEAYYAQPLELEQALPGEGEGADALLRFPLKKLGVYRPERGACLLPQGRYWVFVGEDWPTAVCAGSLFLTQEIITCPEDRPEQGAQEYGGELSQPLPAPETLPEIILNPFDLPA